MSRKFAAVRITRSNSRTERFPASSGWLFLLPSSPSRSHYTRKGDEGQARSAPRSIPYPILSDDLELAIEILRSWKGIEIFHWSLISTNHLPPITSLPPTKLLDIRHSHPSTGLTDALFRVFDIPNPPSPPHLPRTLSTDCRTWAAQRRSCQVG